MSSPTTTNRLAHDLDDILARTEPLWQELRGQRILITGATGFFGCWLLESFAWANRRLNLKAHAVATCRGIRERSTEKAPHLADDAAITCTPPTFVTAISRKDTFSHVIHAATEASAALNNEDPLVMFDTIVEGTRRALQFSIASSVARFLLVSSGAVYGPQPPQLAHVSESFRRRARSSRPCQRLCRGQARGGVAVLADGIARLEPRSRAVSLCWPLHATRYTFRHRQLHRRSTARSPDSRAAETAPLCVPIFTPPT